MGSQVAPPGAKPWDGVRGGSPAKKIFGHFLTEFNGKQAFLDCFESGSTVKTWKCDVRFI